MQKITTFLWFDNQAEEAMNFYVSIFRDSKVLDVSRYGEAGHEVHGKPAGSAMTCTFELADQKFIALNGGPMFKFTEAISLFVECEDQEEVDYFWNKLSDGGDPNAQQCGWLKDKYGLSWQVVPKALGQLLSDPDPAASGRVMEAMLKMKKIDVATLQQAHG